MFQRLLVILYKIDLEPVSKLSSVGAALPRSVLSPLNVRVPTETVVLKVCPVV
ncbi:hypothetical protein LEP1GSC133_2060 [Leptospira borgpetersenii serovar Pomona str. 200901868]|uniref:Uncharacterized protein n=1 Tax=Leptospira borgpetersenii serovar Pomona str. 200901868 TaxID=1192866 RepID=M6WJF3_LEPBO|nr:hypothetical protein LEP1GSC133_2060 [Leptospira borgpetersenii serovar Pomona str. 200901868]